MLWKGFQRPKRVEVDTETLTATYGRFTAQPFERGFATTIGNALRRCLLSSIEGAAITAVNIEGVLHEFSSIPGVRRGRHRHHPQPQADRRSPCTREEPKVLSIDVQGPGAVTAGHMTEDPQIEIFDPNVHIATVNEEGRLKLQAQIEARPRLRLGRPQLRRVDGHRLDPGRLRPQPGPAGQLPGRGGPPRPDHRLRAPDPRGLDQRHGPPRGGGVARLHAAQGPPRHLHPDRGEPAARRRRAGPRGAAGLDALLAKNIDELDLSVRSANSLKNANIHTLRDLVRRTEKDMLETKNFGKKSLEEVQEVLDKLGLSLGMDVPDPAARASA